MHEFINEHICGVRLANAGSWNEPREEEIFTYRFNPLPKFNPTVEWPQPPAETEPDDRALDELFKRELVWRLPKVKS